MKKALEILKSINRLSVTDRVSGLLDLAIAELEVLENKSCENCEYNNDNLSDTLNYCCNCSRNHKDLWQSKN